MDDSMQETPPNNAESANEQVLDTKTSGKSDLRDTKKELFNKLIANKSHQIIVTATSKTDGAESLNSVNSLSGLQNYQAETLPEEQLQQYQLLQTSSGKHSNLQQQQQPQQPQHFLPEDFKREPVVFTRSRSRWYTNEEVASILTSFSSHPEWQTNELQVRPKSGAVLLYSREKVRYRQDGYCWKKRKNGRTTREDHMKLKVQGIECIYGCYVHSALLPTFHRRCYWLLQNPDIVLVHYLNQPPEDQKKMMLSFDSSLLEADTRRSWTNQEIIEEIGSVFGGISQIRHTLSINFPPTKIITQKQQPNQQQLQSSDSERMIESSPQSTGNYDSMNEQVEMAVLDQQSAHEPEYRLRPIASHGGVRESQDIENDCELDEDELMTTLSHEADNNEIQLGVGELNDLNCAETTNGQGHHRHHHSHHQQQQQLSGTIGMTFNVVGGCEDRKNSLCDSRQQQGTVECFDDYANNISVNNQDDIGDGGGGPRDNNIINEVSSRNGQTNERLEQNPCSPVTQIYNKIVDDIETYALPLEPNQFNPNHHHHGLSMSSLPVQPMDVVSEVANHDQHLHHDQQQQQRRQEQQRQQQRHHHNHDQQDHQQLDQQCQNLHGHEAASDHQSACSMDLISCDLFGNEPNPSDQTSQEEGHEGDADDNLLLTEFSLPSGVNQESDGLTGGVVDSLTNADDLRDLIMGISSNGNCDHNNLLVDSNTLDLFTFKASECEQIRPQSHEQQLDIKLSTSDAENTSRLSPMVPAPRCSSTGNPVHSGGFHLNNQHLSASNYLPCTEGNLTQPNNFLEFHNNQSSQRSSSANPSSSTSCSPTPSSSSSLRVGALTSAGSIGIEASNQYVGVAANSSTPSSIKLPLPQRQKSEQQEPSNTILNSLLPKALSLDGCDLTAGNHRLPVSPLISYDQDGRHDQNQDHTSLLISHSKLNQQEAPQNLPIYTTNLQESGTQHHTGAPTALASNIPTDNPSEILVNSSMDNYLGSPAYSMIQPQQQSSQSLSCEESLTTISNINSQLLPIVDYVPNWSNITGGAKVLIVGNWVSLLRAGVSEQKKQQFTTTTSSSHTSSSPSEQESQFFAIFDDLLVPATLIQDNVLKCYAPSHEQGFITLKVLYMNRIVSEQVLFEMRPSCTQSSNQIGPIYHGNNHNDGQDPYTDNNNNYSISGGNVGGSNTSGQHRNSTSSNQSASASFSTQKSQASPSGGDSISGDSSARVLTLAENIISAMHKKNACSAPRRHADQARPFGNSLDVEYFDYQRQLNFGHQSNCQRQYSLKGAQRRLTGSRSLSRDSELNSGYGACNGGYSFLDGDPYWHQSPARDYETMQPLSVVTDLPTTGPVSGQKRHSSGSSGFLACRQYQQSAFSPYAQRPTLALMYQNQQQQLQGSSCATAYHQMTTGPLESQNFTETSSSGLGSIVSSLSPSTSSLHSPSSACTAATRDGARENQSPCSCGRQSSRTPTSADFCEYFQASARTQESFASLTLNDSEQRELYEAAKVIQKAYRMYRGRKRQASELLVEPNGTLIETQLEGNYQSASNPLAVRASDSMDEQMVEDSSNNGSGGVNGQQRRYSCLAHSRSSSQKKQQQLLQQPQQQQQSTLVKCYRDREMQAATIIQAYYRRYRQYVHFNRQQTNSNRQQLSSSGSVKSKSAIVGMTTSSANDAHRAPPLGARLVVDPMPVIIDKATTSHVDRKRFKTASLISSCGVNAACRASETILKESSDCPQS